MYLSQKNAILCLIEKKNANLYKNIMTAYIFRRIKCLNTK